MSEVVGLWQPEAGIEIVLSSEDWELGLVAKKRSEGIMRELRQAGDPGGS